MPDFGLAPKKGRNDCTHLGGWVYRQLGSDMAIRYCEGCGRTSVLAQMPDPTFALIEVPEHGTEKWTDLADLGQDVLPLPAAEGVERVPSGPDDDGRLSPLVQALQAGAVPPSYARALRDAKGGA